MRISRLHAHMLLLQSYWKGSARDKLLREPDFGLFQSDRSPHYMNVKSNFIKS